MAIDAVDHWMWSLYFVAGLLGAVLIGLRPV